MKASLFVPKNLKSSHAAVTHRRKLLDALRPFLLTRRFWTLLPALHHEILASISKKVLNTDQLPTISCPETLHRVRPGWNAAALYFWVCNNSCALV